MKNGQNLLKFVVIGGSAIIAINSVMQLTKTKTFKGATMPLITLLVGVSAFSYAMGGEKITFVPQT